MKLKRKGVLGKNATLASLFVGVAILSQLLPGGGAASGQTVASAQAQAAAIAARLNALGAQASRMIQNYDQAEASLSQVNQKIKDTQNQMSGTQSQIASIRVALSQEAIDSYMTGGNLSTLYALFNENPTQAAVRQEFLNTVTNSQADLVASYQAAVQSLHMQQASLKTLQDQAISVLSQATAAKNAVLAAEVQQKAQLASENSLVASLVAQQQAAQAAAAQAAAAQAAAAQAAILAQQAAARAHIIAASAPSVTPVKPFVGGTYGNPLRSIAGLSPERIDQGVDYHGYGPIYALGNGVVLSVYNSGWPGGTFISYRLTQGPAAGLVVYAAEDIRPQIGLGQSVTPNTVIGTMYEGFAGIETGWASPSLTGETMARTSGQFGGSNSTAYGFNFSQLLRSLGAPGGVLQNNPPTGSLLSGWPVW